MQQNHNIPFYSSSRLTQLRRDETFPFAERLAASGERYAPSHEKALAVPQRSEQGFRSPPAVYDTNTPPVYDNNGTGIKNTVGFFDLLSTNFTRIESACINGPVHVALPPLRGCCRFRSRRNVISGRARVSLPHFPTYAFIQNCWALSSS